MAQWFRRRSLKCEKFTDDRRQVMAIVHMDLWSRWTNNTHDKFLLSYKNQCICHFWSFLYIIFYIFYMHGYDALRHFQHYFSYIVAVSFIGGGNRQSFLNGKIFLTYVQLQKILFKQNKNWTTGLVLCRMKMTWNKCIKS